MEDNLIRIRDTAKSFYQQNERVYCPYFKEEIVFNAEGFNHIRYKRARKERHKSVQFIRYKLLPLAYEVVRDSKTLQEYEERKIFIKIRSNKRKEKILKKVCFYGFIAIVKNWKVKVIVRQVGNGSKHFWSIIPNWKTRKSKESKIRFLKHTGDLFED